jgi:hypothetical protein
VVGAIAICASAAAGGTLNLYPPDGSAFFHIDAPGQETTNSPRLRFSYGAAAGQVEVMSVQQSPNANTGSVSIGQDYGTAIGDSTPGNSLRGPSNGLVVEGSVGIGTTVPAEYTKLEVYTGGSGDDENLSINSPSTFNGFSLQFVNPSQAWAIGPNIGDFGDGGLRIVDITHTAYVMTILPTTGNVGIGTQTPDANFAVYGNFSTDNGYIQSDGAGDLSVYSVSGSTFVVTGGSSGNVGIGTATPQATLDINGFARLTPQGSAPATCSSSNVGAIALTLDFNICICNGSTWIFATSLDGRTAGQTCQWFPS